MARAKKTAEPAKRGRGRPAIPGLQQLAVRVDGPALEGLEHLCLDFGVGQSEAVRLVLSAYCQSETVRAAVAAWKESR